MKSAIIFVLLAALVGAAVFTRPSQDDFQRFIVAKSSQGDTGILKTTWDQSQADAFVKQCTFNNRFLWVNVQQNGQTIYTGAFGHWFNRADITKGVNAVKTEADAAKQKVESIKIGN